jgi:G:T/U-mismatch repair DNA glycosylase
MRIIDNFKDYEDVESFNRETTLNDETKLLIVGTLTPPDGSGKYFYSTTLNSIYGLIDEALNNGEKLETLKGQFKDYNDSRSNKDEVDSNNKVVRDKIKEYLKDNKIAFLDVIKYAKRNKRSPDDKKIIVAELDYGAFEDLINIKRIIANSKDAKKYLEKILDKVPNGLIYKDRIIYLPQKRKGFRREDWVEEIRNTLDIKIF